VYDVKYSSEKSLTFFEREFAPQELACFAAVRLRLSTMDNERIREICLSLPFAAETLNWGHHLVYWVGDREIGGKMFAMTDVDGTGRGVLWFHCGAERFYELLEVEGIFAAPHLARAHWVAVERWNALRPVKSKRSCGAHMNSSITSFPSALAPCWPCRKKSGPNRFARKRSRHLHVPNPPNSLAGTFCRGHS
jgi:predicted DNA-binding protein (MmcQ/YjbR family)